VIRRKAVSYKPTVEYLEEAVVNGRRLRPGTEVSIRSERGRFRFVNAQITKSGLTVLNFIGGPSGHEVWRSFYPERVRRVHRVKRTWANREEGAT
jgi:hypothetical protein